MEGIDENAWEMLQENSSFTHHFEHDVTVDSVLQ
jgi:hypothetical protein